MWIVNHYAHSKFNFLSHKVLSSEQGTFMMLIVEGRFANYIMNTHIRLHGQQIRLPNGGEDGGGEAENMN
jgi:hypothetical protein